MKIVAPPQAYWIPPAGVDEAAARQAAPTMRRLGRSITRTARRRVNVRTGHLRSTLGDTTTRTGPVVTTTVFANARYARWVESGSRPHAIVPRRAKALRFEVGGRVVFAKRVWHPGYRGSRFLSSSVRDELARANLT